MKSSDVIDAVRRVDPAAQLHPLDPQARDLLLARILRAADARPARKPRAGRHRFVAALVTACALGASVAVLTGRGSADLAERAYAATDPETGIIHELVETYTADHSANGVSGQSRSRTELWIRPSDGTWRAIADGVENAMGGDHVLRSWTRSGRRVHTMPARELARAPKPPGFDLLRRDVVAAFRAAYARGGLRDTGVRRLAGQRVRCYRESPQPHAVAQSWCISLATSLPVATTYRVASAPRVTTERTVVVKRYERLPATPANLAKLRFAH